MQYFDSCTVIFSGSFVRETVWVYSYTLTPPVASPRVRAQSCFSTRMNLSLSTGVTENLLTSLTVKTLVISSTRFTYVVLHGVLAGHIYYLPCLVRAASRSTYVRIPAGASPVRVWIYRRTVIECVLSRYTYTHSFLEIPSFGTFLPSWFVCVCVCLCALCARSVRYITFDTRFIILRRERFFGWKIENWPKDRFRVRQ